MSDEELLAVMHQLICKHFFHLIHFSDAFSSNLYPKGTRDESARRVLQPTVALRVRPGFGLLTMQTPTDQATEGKGFDSEL